MSVKFCPFSHIPGTAFILPGSSLVCKVYPALVELFDLSKSKEVAKVPFEFGPLTQFTVVQDLEKGHIQVSGFAKSGFIRYQIYAGAEDGSWEIRMQKGEKKRKISLERLYLGCDKQQKWPDIAARLDMREILPLWYALMQWVPKLTGDIFSGDSLASQIPDGSLDSYKALFQAGFDAGFVPRLVDRDHLGYSLPVVANANVSPLLLLTEVSRHIRGLFFAESDQFLSILPKLDAEFHSGSFTNVRTKRGHTLCMDWSKHLIRTIEITSACEDVLRFNFQKEVKLFRVRQRKNEPGTYFKRDDVISIEPGKKYYIDSFQT